MAKNVIQNDKWHRTKAGNDAQLVCGARNTSPDVKLTDQGLAKQRAICEGCKTAIATRT